MSGTRRVFVGRAALGLLVPVGWSAAATAPDRATMPLDTLIAQAANLSPASLYMLAGR